MHYFYRFKNTKMNNIKHLYTFLVLILCINLQGFSQTVIGRTSYEFIGDNREYFNSYGFPQTILASRASQELGLQIDSSQKIMFGGSYMITHGANQFEQKPILTSYYEYNKRKSHTDYSCKVGSFPLYYNQFPTSIYSDSMMYVRPNMQGIRADFFNYSSHKIHGYGTGIFDWLQQKNYGEQESFLAGYNGTLCYKNFRLNNYYYYRHFAADNNTGSKDVQDNGALGVTIGYNSYNLLKTKADTIPGSGDQFSFTCKIGSLTTWFGQRPAPKIYAGGFIADASIEYNKFEIKGLYYYGDGTQSPLGDPLYRCGNYGRIDAKYTFLYTKNVIAYFSFNTHFIDSDINFSQNISVKATIDYKHGK